MRARVRGAATDQGQHPEERLAFAWRLRGVNPYARPRVLARHGNGATPVLCLARPPAR